MLNATELLFVLGAAAVLSGKPLDDGRAPARPCGAFIVVHADTTVDARLGWPTQLLQQHNPKTPRYPEALRAQSVAGEVRTSFVIDTLGEIIPGSVEVTSETERGFGDAVCKSLVGARFTTAMVGGRRLSVRIVNNRTSFTLQR